MLRAQLITSSTVIALLLVAGTHQVSQANAEVPKWAWADVGAGLASAETGPFSILIATCASMALIRIRPRDNSTWPPIRNPDNPFDKAGALHNQIIKEYFAANGDFTTEKYYRFIQKNKARYGVPGALLGIETFAVAARTYGNPSAPVSAQVARIRGELAANGIKIDILGPLTTLPTNQTYPQLAQSILQIERKALASKDLTPAQRERLGVFFSILRYSSALKIAQGAAN